MSLLHDGDLMQCGDIYGEAGPACHNVPVTGEVMVIAGI
jgi:hypothetical protein